MFQIDAKIVSNKKISEKYFLITFLGDKIARESLPGQFIMVKVDNEKTFLRRPFSICSTGGKTFSILFKVVGIGTEILSKKKTGDVLNIIGPLGTDYLVSRASCLVPIFVAGGTGVASLLFLASKIKSPQKPMAFLGFKTKSEILFEPEFKKLGCEVIVSTEDGSYGKKGLITDIFKKFLLPTFYSLLPVVYACGPKKMLKEVAEICKSKKLKCYVSLEERMACGVGACMGCVIKTIENEKLKIKDDFGYKRVCKDGPVFDAEKIIWK